METPSSPASGFQMVQPAPASPSAGFQVVQQIEASVGQGPPELTTVVSPKPADPENNKKDEYETKDISPLEIEEDKDASGGSPGWLAEWKWTIISGAVVLVLVIAAVILMMLNNQPEAPPLDLNADRLGDNGSPLIVAPTGKIGNVQESQTYLEQPGESHERFLCPQRIQEVLVREARELDKFYLNPEVFQVYMSEKESTLIDCTVEFSQHLLRSHEEEFLLSMPEFQTVALASTKGAISPELLRITFKYWAPALEEAVKLLTRSIVARDPLLNHGMVEVSHMIEIIRNLINTLGDFEIAMNHVYFYNLLKQTRIAIHQLVDEAVAAYMPRFIDVAENFLEDSVNALVIINPMPSPEDSHDFLKNVLYSKGELMYKIDNEEFDEDFGKTLFVVIQRVMEQLVEEARSMGAPMELADKHLEDYIQTADLCEVVVIGSESSPGGEGCRCSKFGDAIKSLHKGDDLRRILMTKEPYHCQQGMIA